MTFELHLYDEAAGFNDDGAPVKIDRTILVDLPPASTVNRFDVWTDAARAQAMADLLDSMAAHGRVAT